MYFDSAAKILEEFDLPKDGFHYRRLVEGFRRVFMSTIYFDLHTTNSLSHPQIAMLLD